MSKTSTVVLFAAELVVLAVLAVALYFRAMPLHVTTPVFPARNEVLQTVAEAPQAAAPAAAHSVYVSEETLKRSVSEAADRHWDLHAQALLRTLNGRFERRCCGLPR